MAELPNVDLGGELLTREDALARLTSSMLARLPLSLWDQDPQTVQGQLYSAVAAELVTWLETWGVVRDCTLLQRAGGVDLDTLLSDYGIKRYNRRPDPQARQIGRQVLFTPKETLFRLQDLAQLMTDYDQLVARSGRQQPHYWIGATHPVTVVRTYWQLADDEGRMWYFLMEHNELVLSRAPAPGANVTPTPDGRTVSVPGAPPWHTWGKAPAYPAGRGDVEALRWFTARDGGGGLWYVTLATSGVFAVSADPPPPGPGTSQRVELLDGNGHAWRVLVEPTDRSLMPIEVVPESAPATYWRLRDVDGHLWYLFIADEVPSLSQQAPLWLDTTPGGQPLDWFVVQTPLGVTRFVVVTHQGEFDLVPDQPAGTGTVQQPILVDALHTAWSLALEEDWSAMRLDDVLPDRPGYTEVMLVDPQAQQQMLVLHDATPEPWSLWVAGRELTLWDAVPTDIANATPPGGPFGWWRLDDLHGQRFAVTPDGNGELLVQTTTPPGLGTVEPYTLGDAEGTIWHAGIALDGSLGISDTPPVVWSDAETCLILNDAAGVRWFWCLEESTGEITCSDAEEPDSIPYMKVGEVGALAVQTPGGEVRYIYPGMAGSVMSGSGGQLDHPWSLDTDEAPLYDDEGRAWTLRMAEDGSIVPMPHLMEDIPMTQDPIYVRDLYDAMRRIEAAGSLTTFWVG